MDYLIYKIQHQLNLKFRRNDNSQKKIIPFLLLDDL